ncbi:hypothetical protein HPB49_021473 [Dermacentor silvarum]|uniref:Uncharacterized protein n=1 Tax=Dermacentor silvarum TaxID=543639 RepID=A0ACB8D7X1_DERSI|nr:hypothetical protein HPB49_021473 [Dermacentor silvarum]
MDFRAGIVHFLLDAYTARVISKNSSQGEAVRKLFQSAVLKSIVPLKKTKLTEFVDFLSALLLRIKASLGDGASTDIKKCLKKTKHTLERLDSAAGLDEPVSTAFKVLLLYLTILTALGISDDPSSLQEVCSSVRDLLSDTSEAEEGAEEGHKAKWVQLVVDLALSMLSMQSLHVRAIATAAFALLHNQLSDESLALLLDVTTTPEDDLLIVAACVAEPFQTAREICDNLGLNVSERLIRHRLEEAGLHSCILIQKSLLSARHCQLRLSFTEQHRTWSAADWNIVVCSDQSTFCTRWDQHH